MQQNSGGAEKDLHESNKIADWRKRKGFFNLVVKY